MSIPTPNYPSPAQVLERRDEVACKVFDWFNEESAIDRASVGDLHEQHPDWQGELVEHLILAGCITFPVPIPVPAASTTRGFPATSPGGFDFRGMSAVADEVPE
jgi:hypothetical protein